MLVDALILLTLPQPPFPRTVHLGFIFSKHSLGWGKEASRNFEHTCTPQRNGFYVKSSSMI